MAETWACQTCATTNGSAAARCQVCGAAPTGFVQTPDQPRPPLALVPVHRRESGSAQPQPGAPVPTGPARYPSAPPPTPARSVARPIAIAIALGCVAALIGVGAFVIAGGNDQDHVAGASSTDDSTLEPGDAGQDEWSSPTNEDLGDDDEDPVVIVTTPTTEPVAATRQAQLWARTAKLRDAPRLDATEIRTFTDEEGRAVTVIGALDAGWYEVEIDGMHGFLYGGLVTPPDPGHCVLLMGDGWPYAKQSTRVIVSISPSGDLVATLPEGGEVVVTSGDIRDQQCA